MALVYPVIFIALLVGMICTFRKPTLQKYMILIPSETIAIVLCILRALYIDQASGLYFGEVLSIIILFLPFCILLLVTICISIYTRKRWCFKDTSDICEG